MPIFNSFNAGSARKFGLSKGLGPPAFTISSASESRQQNTAITGYTVTSTGGLIASFSISPAAPGGLTFNTSTGVLSGTPTTVQSATVYTITATNATGSTTRTFALTVTVSPPAFTISSSSESKVQNTAITGYTVTSTGGAIASFSVSPAVTAGLSFNTSTGRITGTPSTVNTTTYTITATNATGSTTRTFALTVTAPPFLATGGTETTMGGYRYLRFTSSQNMSVTYSGSAEVLVVAGGGGGGIEGGGGGGGGGVRRAGNTTYQTLNFAAGNAYVTVGGGGGTEASGGASSIVHAAGTLAASGGGRGGSNNNVRAGSSGGSGGGGCKDNGPGSGNSGGYSPAEGFSGGSGNGSGGNSGGGAASGAGSGSNHLGGEGFNVGTLDPNLTTVLGYTVVGSGGGGGGDCNTGGSFTGAGSGAGAGGYGNDATSGSSWGSGGGGSAGCFGALYPGGSGRQGVVVVRFPV